MWFNTALHRMDYIFTEQQASTIVAYTHGCVVESQRLRAKSGTRQLCFSTPRARWFSKSTCRETWRWTQCCVKRKKKLKISVGWMRKGRYIYLHTMWCASSAVAIYQLDDETECKNCTGYMALTDQRVSCSITRCLDLGYLVRCLKRPWMTASAVQIPISRNVTHAASDSTYLVKRTVDMLKVWLIR
jgi:hypothetical protein